MKQIFTLVLAAMISACTASDDALYPSLAPRPIEKIAAQDPASAVPAAQPADPALSIRIMAVQAALADAENTLQQAVVAAAAPAPAAERGSEAWVANQQGISDLVRAQAGLRSIGDDIGAIAADVAQARVGGADTAALDAQLAMLRQRINDLTARAQAETDKRR